MENNKRKTIIGTMASVSGIVIIAKILGFVKQIITANAFGATIQTDIISISEGLVLNLDYLLIQTLSTAFIPIYISAKGNGKEDAKKFVSSTIKILLLITVAISILFFMSSPVIAKILAPSYNDELSTQLSKYIKIFAPVVILLVEMAVFNSLLKANEIFVPGELITFFQHAIVIALVIAVGNKFGTDTLVIAFYVYAIFNLIFLMYYSRKYWVILKGSPFTDVNIRKLLAMMGPLLLGYAMIFVNQQVDKIIVSGLEEGTVTAMTYAASLSNFVNTFVGSICTVLFTYVTQRIVDKRDKDAAVLTTKSSVQLITLLLPISILAIVNAYDIVTIIFGRGKFDAKAVSSCALALVGYSFSFVPFAIRELYSRFQYSYRDSKTPMINSTIAIMVNIALSILLSIWWGVLGVTVATSVSVLICALLNVKSARKKNASLDLRLFKNYIPGWLLGGAACVVISCFGKSYLGDLQTFLRFIIIALISLGIYGIVNYKAIKPMVNMALKRTK